MGKSFYYDTNENKWKSVRGHDSEGAVWVDNATEDEIREYLTKIPELADARAEIESLTRSLTIVANWKNVKRTYTADEVKEFARGILDVAALEAAERVTK